MVTLNGRDFLSVSDFDASEIHAFLKSIKKLKPVSPGGTHARILEGKVVGLLFEHPSTRTRVSFESAAMRLGADVLYMRPDELQLKRREPIKDTARVLSGYLDVLVYRTSNHDTLVELAEHARMPIINALSDLEHPTQALSDLAAIEDAKGSLHGLKLTWIGDGNNVCNSLMLACASVGVNISIATPPNYQPDAGIARKANELAQESNSKIWYTDDPFEAAEGADVLYTDVWVSMGQDAEQAQRVMDFEGFQINDELVAQAKSDAVVMHCLPAHRGLEITDEVLEGPKSIAWKQADYKFHGAKGILASILG
ncbi:MAG: ornithine carbamoyltransferase [Candidatus Bathyarchaeia archaeon]